MHIVRTFVRFDVRIRLQSEPNKTQVTSIRSALAAMIAAGTNRSNEMFVRLVDWTEIRVRVRVNV